MSHDRPADSKIPGPRVDQALQRGVRLYRDHLFLDIVKEIEEANKEGYEIWETISTAFDGESLGELEVKGKGAISVFGLRLRSA